MSGGNEGLKAKEWTNEEAWKGKKTGTDVTERWTKGERGKGRRQGQMWQRGG